MKEKGHRVMFYVASKTKHANMWRRLRDSGEPIISTWIDEAEEGQTSSYSELAARCIAEISSSSALVLYCEDGDVLKGALIETGVALALGIPVYCVGTCDSISRVFSRHSSWNNSKSLATAMAKAKRHAPTIEDERKVG